MQELKFKLEKILERLKSDLASLRTGRASPALVENLEVEYYGAKNQLKSLAAIGTPDAKTIVIQAWDKAALPAIEKAILGSNLGLNPITDSASIRISVPALTEERRRDLKKIVGRNAEDARIQVRREREGALKESERLFREKKISEDEKFRTKQETEKIVQEFNKKIEELVFAKEKELETI